MEISKLIESIGYLGIFAIVYAESGMFFGFFLPGDSLLFTAGLLASRGHFNIFILLIGITLAAILGDSFGYWFGKKFGKSIFEKGYTFANNVKNNLLRKVLQYFFNPDHIRMAENFFAKKGNLALVISRFIPVIRTFTPIIAGIGNMEYKQFIKYNIIGGLLWGVGLTMMGYFLGATLGESVDKYLMPIIILIVIVSLVISYFESKKAKLYA